jgi:hypothetical protein
MTLLSSTLRGIAASLIPVILFLVCALSAPRAGAQCASAVFYEGFETGTIVPTWTSVATTTAVTWTVNTVNPYTGNFKFQMTGLTSHLGGVAAAFAASTPTYVSWSIYPQYFTGATNYFVLGDASVTYSHCLVFCGYVANSSTIGDIRFFTNSTFTNYPAAPQQWYKIELKNINYTAQTSDIWINNVLFTTGFPFRSNGLNNVSRVHLYNLSAVGTSIWDDIMIGDGLFASMSLGKPSCHGGSNGASTITPVGGMAPYTYSWSTSATTSVVTNLSANTVYTAQVTDANSCVATKTIMLTQPSSLTASFFTQSVSCYGGANGQAAVSAGGGTSPYTYSWTTLSATNQMVSAIAAGIYTVNVLDANSCPASFTVSVPGPTSAVAASTSVTPVNCFGDSNGIAFVQGTGGTGPYTYSWVTVGGTGQQKQNLPSGTYTCVVKDQNNCAHSTTVLVSSPPDITAQLTSTNITCLLQGAAQVSASGGTPPFSYSWLPWGGTTAPVNHSLVAGTQSVVVTDSKGCSHTVTFSIGHNTVVPVVTIAGVPPTAVCVGQSIILSAGGNGDTFLWSNGSNAASIVITPTVTAQYSVEARFNSNGCTATSLVTLLVSQCTGIGSYSANEFPILFPNPSDGEVHIISDSPGYFGVYSSSGREVVGGRINAGRTNLCLDGLTGGMYVIRIRTNGHEWHEKLIIR